MFKKNKEIKGYLVLIASFEFLVLMNNCYQLVINKQIA